MFSDVAQAATEATFSYTGQKELSELNSKFDKIIQARESGKGASILQVRAREDLNAAKANSPWVAEQADKLFREKFSGGGSTGIFKATPQEKAASDHLELVEETRLKLGLSTGEEAQKRISLDENAKSAKLQAEAQKQVRNYNGELVFSNTQAQLNSQSIKMMDAMNRIMKTSGGTLSNDAVRDVTMTVDQTALQLKQELNTQTRDERTGHILIDKAGYDANLKEIEDWAAQTKAVAADSSYLKIIQDLNTEQSAEINYVATNKYRTLKELGAAGGQAAVNAYLVAARTKEGAAKQLLIGANPIAKDMFKQGGSFNQASSDGLDKIILPTPASLNMSQQEAMATGTVLNDPKNAKLLISTVDKVSTEPEAVEPFKSMIKQNPDSSAVMWSQQFKSWAYQNKPKAQTVMDSGMDALKKAFLSAYVSDTNKLPTDFEIKDSVREMETVRTKGGRKEVPARGKGSFRRNVVVGEGVTKETGKILSNMLGILVQNPEYAKKVASDLGTPDATPQQLVRSVVLGNAAPVEEAPATPSKEVKPDGFTGATKPTGMSEEEAIKVLYEADVASATTELEKERAFGKLLRGEYRRDGVIEKAKTIKEVSNGKSK